VREVIRQAIEPLPGRLHGFGSVADRPTSLYAALNRARSKDRDLFAELVWIHAMELGNVVPPRAIGILHEFDDPAIDPDDRPREAARSLLEVDFSDAQLQRLQEVANLVDLYGFWWLALRQDERPRSLSELVRGWMLSNAPGALPTLATFLSSLAARCRKDGFYHFDCDFIRHRLIPRLRETQLAHLATSRPCVGCPRLRDYLRNAARIAIGALSPDYPADGIDQEEIVLAVLLALGRTPADQYDVVAAAHGVRRLARRLLVAEITSAVYARCIPQHPLSEPGDELEQLRRRLWLRAFIKATR
jgi:hypothetical protein